MKNKSHVLLAVVLLGVGVGSASAAAGPRSTSKGAKKPKKAKKVKKARKARKARRATRANRKANGQASPAATPKGTRKTKSNSGKKRVCSAPEPTAMQCVTPEYQTLACVKKYASICRKPILDRAKADFEASKAPTIPMLSVDGEDIPKDLRSGKYHPYPGPRKGRMLGRFTDLGTVPGPTPGKSSIDTSAKLNQVTKAIRGTKSPARLGSKRKKFDLTRTSAARVNGRARRNSVGIFSRTGLARPGHSGKPFAAAKKAHREPAWEANGHTVASCEEYGYEQVYDWARFTDSMAACGGDHKCQLDIAFLPDTPGIADRTLTRKDGKPLRFSLQHKIATKGQRDKNMMFFAGAFFAYAGGQYGVAPSPPLEELSETLTQGAGYYKFGRKRGTATTKFKDEWDFHAAMYDRNRTLSPAEFEEYDRRKAEFRHLLEQWAQAVKTEMDALARTPVLTHGWVDPIDTLMMDPLAAAEAFGRMSDYIGKQRPALMKRLNKAELKKIPGGKMTPEPVGGGLRFGIAAPLVPKIAEPRNGASAPTAAVGVLAAPRPRPRKGPATTPPQNASKPKNPTAAPIDPCRDFKGVKVREFLGVGPLSCRIGQFLREEWKRKMEGQKSCLDLDNDDCDWSPSEFEARFVKGVPYLDVQNAYEVECVDYTNDTFPAAPSLDAMETHIAKMRSEIGETMRELRPYKQTNTPGLKKFGRGWGDNDQFGDKDWFAAGYGYNVGWGVEAKSPKNDGFCDLAGETWADFDIDAWLVTKKVSVVDAHASLDVNQTVKGGSTKAHLKLLGQNVFTPVNEQFNTAFQKDAPWGSKSVPKPKPAFTFWAGPVPITGSAWAQVRYGANLEFGEQSNANCDLSKLRFGAKANFAPYVALDAKAQVGVGISGIASAGVRGLLNLITLEVPIDTGLAVTNQEFAGHVQPGLGFDLDIKLALSTLSGYLALYVEFLFYEEEWELFRWNGVGPKEINLLGEPISVALPLFVMGQ